MKTMNGCWSPANVATSRLLVDARPYSTGHVRPGTSAASSKTPTMQAIAGVVVGGFDADEGSRAWSPPV